MTRRAPGIDYDAVPASLSARALGPGDPGYSRYTAGYLPSGAPGLVLRPQNPRETQDAVRFADSHRDVPLGIYSAGHGLSGRSLNVGGLVIDVSAVNNVEPLGDHRVRIGPGARWIDVSRVLRPLGLAISSFPYLVPPSLTVWQAAAAPASQIFLLLGTLMLLPIVIGYIVFVYWLFRGKVMAGESYEH